MDMELWQSLGIWKQIAAGVLIMAILVALVLIIQNIIAAIRGEDSRWPGEPDSGRADGESGPEGSDGESGAKGSRWRLRASR